MAGNIEKQGGNADYSSIAVPHGERMKKGSLTMAWWAICSAMFWLVVAATLAMNFGTLNAVIGLILSVLCYGVVNGIIARYAIRTGLSVALFSRVLFGHLGAAQTEYTIEDLGPGEHTVIAVLGDYQHVRIAEVAPDTVRFTVGPAGS